MKSLPTSAKSLGLLQCHDCHLLIRSEDIPAHHAHCPRCGAPLHFRKPDSIARTWALLLAASIMYIPADRKSVV